MARGRRRNGAVDFTDGFNATYGTARQVLKDAELNRIANEKPESSTAFTESQGEQLQAAADSGQYDVSFDQATGQYNVTPKAGGETGVLAPQKSTTFMGKTVAGDMSQQQVDQARMLAMSGVLGKFGDPAKAAQLSGEAGRLQEEDQRRADNAELRAVMSGRSNDVARASIGTGADLGGAVSGSPGYAETRGVQPSPVAKPGKAPSQTDFVDNWMTDTGPKAMMTLLKQGKVTEAVNFAKFMDSEEGNAYAREWLQGVRAHSVGDSEGALKQFEKLYNRQGFNDGHTVELTPLDNGKRYAIVQITADGNRRLIAEGETAKLADSAAMALSPASYAKFMTESQRAKEKEAAQLRVEEIRQQGREDSEDRRDERLAKRLQAESERRSAGGSLSQAQQRSNAEIDAARDAVAGLTPDELRKRTAKTTDTGRENPDYDPRLARASSLAARRKVGSDDLFDQRTAKQPETQAPAYDRKEIAGRFRSDRQMDGFTLGKDTPQGVEVLKGGKIVGHYR